VLAEAAVDPAAHRSSSNKSCVLHISSSPGQNCRREPLSCSAPIFGCVLLPKPLDLAKKKGSAASREEVSEMGGGRS